MGAEFKSIIHDQIHRVVLGECLDPGLGNTWGESSVALLQLLILLLANGVAKDQESISSRMSETQMGGVCVGSAGDGNSERLTCGGRSHRRWGRRVIGNRWA
ncbi:hypothetical protein B0F90DRAFT_170205 [Multifurca ochricompacta]|uniref:Uncharacterized protein n=1 Tax=Multifurca ochricompacta TaxID=376703 RepID=A0AAD4M619_9AGAM|nr:hypothetical protein B0F90DRAFT_170205 [Multifurca ochricompacta]